MTNIFNEYIWSYGFSFVFLNPKGDKLQPVHLVAKQHSSIHSLMRDKTHNKLPPLQRHISRICNQLMVEGADSQLLEWFLTEKRK